MTRAEIEQFAQRLAADAPCFPRDLSEQERIDRAAMNPGFGGSVARSFAQAHLPLPDLVWPATVRQAYLYWCGLTEDPDMLEVEVLNLPENFDARVILSCSLVCRDATDEVIAESFDFSPVVPRLFHDLSFNVRSRLEEPYYILRLLKEIGGASRVGTLPQRSRAHWAIDLLELALRTRRLDDVLAWAGTPRRTAQLADADQLRSEIRGQLLQIAATELSQDRGRPQENRALALLIKFGLLPKAQPATQLPLGFQLGPQALLPLHLEMEQRLATQQGLTTSPQKS